jgi:hypothetical protein
MNVDMGEVRQRFATMTMTPSEMALCFSGEVGQ